MLTSKNKWQLGMGGSSSMGMYAKGAEMLFIKDYVLNKSILSNLFCD